MKRYTTIIKNSKQVQFKDVTRNLGIITVDNISDEELTECETYDEFLSQFLKRNERTTYCCDNNPVFGIIDNPSNIELNNLDFSLIMGADEMYLYILQDPSTNREKVLYTDYWIIDGQYSPILL